MRRILRRYLRPCTITTRRLAVSTILGVVLFVLLYQTASYRNPQKRPVDQPFTYKPRLEPNAGRFRWSDRAPHYPVTSLTPLPSERPKQLPRMQHAFAAESAQERSARLKRRDAVKHVFKRCWQSYRRRAWMMDELAPISGGGKNAFGGWAATLVDALDTLWIMDMKPEFAEAAKAARDIDFTKSADDTTNVFETTIRYLGGFLSAYDLSRNAELLYMAVEVGEMLLAAFDTPNHFPITRWKWENARDGYKQVTPDFMLVSEFGSLSLEFTRLSQLTGDMRWCHAIDRITNMFDRQQMLTKLLGMWPVLIDPRNENLTEGSSFTLGGMSDSTYEYLPKEFMLLGGTAPKYQKMYQLAMDAAIDNLFFRPMTPNNEDILISGDLRTSDDGDCTLVPRGQHLGCFVGGMLGIGGRLFSNATHVDLGRKITEGCVWAYSAMERGIMPEAAFFVPCDSKTTCVWEESKWHDHVLRRARPAGESRVAENVIKQYNLPKGYVAFDDKRYILRPEAIESVFIMYRITGDEKYREHAWGMFKAIEAGSKTRFGNAAISDITIPKSAGPAPRDDRMESFWMAETLKYFYLIFSEPELISLDQYILTTEAHPLRQPL